MKTVSNGPQQLARVMVGTISDVPVYPSGDALSLMREIVATCRDVVSDGVCIVSRDDGDAIAWALARIEGQRS